jgi:catechol 2,3-dioxygenase-like lactoylglutathione lyase family enzyme
MLQSINSQSNIPSDLESSFSAIIVSDIESSIQWYNQVLGYTLVDQRSIDEIGLKQANLENNDLSLELIQLKSAKPAHDLLAPYPPKTRVRGFFKIGYSIYDFDKWISHLNSLDVNINGDVVLNPLTNKRMIIVNDPDGNRIQLFEK